jgi:phage/plasmid-associated DNA primase
MAAPLTIDSEAYCEIVQGTFVEECDRDAILRLLNSGHLEKAWNDKPNLRTEMARQLYENEEEQIRKYAESYDIEAGGVVVKYKKSSKHNWGRPHVAKSLGLTAFRKIVRHTLCGDRYYDIDLSNAQPSILHGLCTINNVPIPPALTRYVQDRDAVLQTVSEQLGCDRSTAKELFLRLTFHGTYNGARGETEGLPPQPPALVAEYQEGLSSLVARFKKENPKLQRFVYRSEDNKRNKDGRFMGLYLQSYETAVINHLIIAMPMCLSEPRKNVKYRSLIYEFDGIKIPKANVDEYPGGLPEVIKLMNKIVAEKFGFPLFFEQKPMDGGYDLTHVKPIEMKPTALSKERIEQIVAIMNNFTNHDAVQTLIDENGKDSHLYLMPAKEWWCWSNGKWVAEDMHAAYKTIQESSLQYINSLATPEQIAANPKVQSAYTRIVKQLNTNAFLSSSLRHAEAYLARRDVHFDHNRDLLGFNNGVYDIIANTFRPAQRDDRVTMSCGYDMEVYDVPSPEQEQHEADIMRVVSMIFPNELVRTLWLTLAASGLTGMAIERFFLLNGSGRNGKGLLNQALQLVLGDYFYNCDCSVLLESPKTKSSGAANPELANINLKRMVVMKEPPKDVKLQNCAIKDLTGGGQIKGRALYSQKTEVLLHLTLCLETNARPPLKEQMQVADVERFVDILYESTFTSNEEKINPEANVYAVDPTLKKEEFWKKRRVAFMNILIRQLQMLHKADYKFEDYIPQCVKDRSMEYLQSSYMPHRIFTQLYEKKDDDKRCSTDPSLNSVVIAITNSEQWYGLSNYVRTRPEHLSASIKKFFRESDIYGRLIYNDSRNRTLTLRGYRRIVDNMEYPSIQDAVVDTDSTSNESFEINSFSSEKV